MHKVKAVLGWLYRRFPVVGWSRTIGRPYTYAIRQSTREHPARTCAGIAVHMALVALGVWWVVASWGWGPGAFVIGVDLTAFIRGFIAGHLFWGGSEVRHAPDLKPAPAAGEQG